MTPLDDTAAGTVALGDLDVRRLGFGAMRLPGSALLGDGASDRRDAVALVRRAVELGVNFVDTADIYGNGFSEEAIADALHPYPDDLVIGTKGGFVPGTILPGAVSLPPGGRPERLRACCEASLRRLRVERIDLYQLHTPDPEVPYEDSIGALVDLVAEGKIRHIGVSNVGRRHLATARELTPIASVQNRYSLGDRSSEKVLDECAASGVAFIPWGPLGADVGGAVAAVAAARGVTPQQVSLAWLLRRSPIMLPIPGTSSLAHLEENVEAARLALSDEDFAALDGTAAD